MFLFRWFRYCSCRLSRSRCILIKSDFVVINLLFLFSGPIPRKINYSTWTLCCISSLTFSISAPLLQVVEVLTFPCLPAYRRRCPLAGTRASNAGSDNTVRDSVVTVDPSVAEKSFPALECSAPSLGTREHCRATYCWALNDREPRTLQLSVVELSFGTLET